MIFLIDRDFDCQYLNLSSYYYQLTDLLVCGQKFHPICQICVSEIVISENGTEFGKYKFSFC